jgi:hypothetical protein
MEEQSLFPHGMFRAGPFLRQGTDESVTFGQSVLPSAPSMTRQFLVWVRATGGAGHVF